MNQTTLSPELEDAIARRNVDRYSDGSLHLANGKPVTTENVAAAVKNVHEQSYGLNWRYAQLETLRALPQDIDVDELRRHLVNDTRMTRRDDAIRQEEHQVRESLQYIADMELALAESNNLTKEQTV